MMAADPTQQVYAIRHQEHPTVLSAAEQAFSMTIVSAAVLDSYNHNIRQGNATTVFRDFRECFQTLFFFTSAADGKFQKDNAVLIEKVGKWFACPINEPARCGKEGIGLFNDYRTALMNSGIINLKK
jgi:hypothetical protein